MLVEKGFAAGGILESNAGFASTYEHPKKSFGFRDLR